MTRKMDSPIFTEKLLERLGGKDSESSQVRLTLAERGTSQFLLALPGPGSLPR
jgi:hypothetical protein